MGTVEGALVEVRELIPRWLFWVAMAIVVAGLAVTKLQPLWQDLRAESRLKRRLELLKLYYEVEKLRPTETSVTHVDDASLMRLAREVLHRPRVQSKRGSHPYLTFRARVGFVLLGSILPPTLWAVLAWRNKDPFFGSAFLTFAVAVPGALLGGLLAARVMESRDRMNAVADGFLGGSVGIALTLLCLFLVLLVLKLAA